MNFVSLGNTDMDIQESWGKDIEKNVNILTFKAGTNTVLKDFSTKLHYTKYTVLHSFIFSFYWFSCDYDENTFNKGSNFNFEKAE